MRRDSLALLGGVTTSQQTLSQVAVTTKLPVCSHERFPKENVLVQYFEDCIDVKHATLLSRDFGSKFDTLEDISDVSNIQTQPRTNCSWESTSPEWLEVIHLDGKGCGVKNAAFLGAELTFLSVQFSG
jgi:hypothetical protein